MAATPESLEIIFQKVEEESEKRAAEEALGKHRPEDVDLMSSETLREAKQRRRGSISITRFGQLPEDMSQKSPSGLTTPIRVSSLASQSAFYQSQVKNASNHSLASRASDLTADAHEEDHTHVTQIHQIAGRQTLSKAVGSLLPRRLSRVTHQPRVIPHTGTMVVGVSVEEATVEAPDNGEETAAATVHTGRLHTQPSKQSMKESLSAESSNSSWRSMAKSITKKFRRRSKPELADSVP